MFKKSLFILALLLSTAANAQNYQATQGSGTTFGSKLVAGVNYPQQVMCDPTTPANCLGVDASGRVTVLQGTSPWVVSNGGTFAVQATQSGTWTVQPGNTANTTAWLVTGTGGTFPATQSGAWTVNPTTAANWGIGSSTQNSTTVANGHLALGQFNTSPTAITSGNMSPLQMDANGNLLVNIKAGAGSGGTALTDNTAFTQGTTSITPVGCLYNTSYANATSGRATVAQCDIAGALYVNVKNSNANGQATSANSSPVVIASDQSAVKVSPQAIATGGSSTTGNIAANNTTAVVVKASAGTLYGVQVYGIGSAPAYLKIYNATSATCGSGTPVKRLMIPAASTAANGAGSNITFGATGINFGTGITYCVTTGITDADTTAPAANTFLVNVDYQ